jgi:hypothetical protein
VLCRQRITEHDHQRPTYRPCLVCRPHYTGYKAALRCLRLFYRRLWNTALVGQEKELPTKGVPDAAERSPTADPRSLQRIS